MVGSNYRVRTPDIPQKLENLAPIGTRRPDAVQVSWRL